MSLPPAVSDVGSHVFDILFLGCPGSSSLCDDICDATGGGGCNIAPSVWHYALVSTSELLAYSFHLVGMITTAVIQ